MSRVIAAVSNTITASKISREDFDKFFELASFETFDGQKLKVKDLKRAQRELDGLWAFDAYGGGGSDEAWTKLVEREFKDYPTLNAKQAALLKKFLANPKSCFMAHNDYDGCVIFDNKDLGKMKDYQDYDD